ncbi:lipase domain-containing protein (plasmid) [Rhizobium etli]|uniref:Lipase domain-containing protein n=1 Tax=Rhizobium etli TaxID=29449 RepID=A0AAN1EN19_RHIET|nr:PLAT/LH2 domain-containing protein [Rhizobium etli]ARQ13166.1 lipase domain-containing protein [Rhizobium etli]
MEHLAFVQAQRCLSVLEIAYAAASYTIADFRNGTVVLSGKSIGTFSDQFEFAAAMGGELIMELDTFGQQLPWIFLRKNDDEALIEVAVRGTLLRSYSEWQTNFGHLILKDTAVELTEWIIPSGPTIAVRKAWLDRYFAIRDTALRAISDLVRERPGYKIEISGHSLGSALATLLAADLVSHFGNTRHTIELITFASPRVGGDQLRSHLNNGNVLVRRFFISGDVVTRVPMRGSLTLPNSGTRTDYLNHVGIEYPLFTSTIVRSPDGRLFRPKHSQKYFWSLHGLFIYLQALKVTYSASVHDFSINPDFEFTRVLLDVRTGDSWDAGTDDDVYGEVLGHGALLDYPWYDDFERTYADIYEFQMNGPHRMADFQRFPLSFETNGVDRWQLRSVTVYLGTAMSTFERTHRPGLRGGSNDYTMVDWVKLGTVEFGNQF